MLRNLLPLLPLTIGPLCWGTTPPAESFHAQGTAVNATLLGLNTVLGDTGVLPTKGGVREADLLAVDIPLVLSGVVAHSDAIGVGDHSEASSTITGLNLFSCGLLITADLIQSRAYATGSSTEAPFSKGSSEIANLVIAGQQIVVSGAPNQTITLPIGKVIINEIQQHAASVTVIAIHVIINGLADIQLARSLAQVGPCSGCSSTCTGTANCSGNFDFLTGGGLLPSVNGLAHFALSLGLNNGSNWGGFLFDDPDSLTSFQATSVAQYLISSATERKITGVGKLNGFQTVTYVLDVVQDSAQAWTFKLTLSNGYSISGVLNLGFLQLRQGCNS